MNAANKLIGGLAGEKARWTQQSEAFADEIRRLTGDVSIACAFMGYAVRHSTSVIWHDTSLIWHDTSLTWHGTSLMWHSSWATRCARDRHAHV
eukprot:5634368-Prymnesium_polylepis.1